METNKHEKFLGCVLPQGTRILFLSCGSNFIVSPKKITDERHPQCAGPPHASVTMSSPVSTRWTKDQDQTSCSTKLVPRRVSTWATWRTRPCFIATLAVGLSPAHCAWHLMTWMCLSASFKVSCFLVQHIVVTSLHPWMRCTLMADIAFTLLVILPPSSPCFDVEQNDLNSQQLPDQLLFVTNCMKETFRFKHNHVTKHGKAKAWQCKIR